MIQLIQTLMSFSSSGMAQWDDIELAKSYRMVLESWELDEANQFLHKALFVSTCG